MARVARSKVSSAYLRDSRSSKVDGRFSGVYCIILVLAVICQLVALMSKSWQVTESGAHGGLFQRCGVFKDKRSLLPLDLQHNSFADDDSDDSSSGNKEKNIDDDGDSRASEYVKCKRISLMAGGVEAAFTDWLATARNTYFVASAFLLLTVLASFLFVACSWWFFSHLVSFTTVTGLVCASISLIVFGLNGSSTTSSISPSLGKGPARLDYAYWLAVIGAALWATTYLLLCLLWWQRRRSQRDRVLPSSSRRPSRSPSKSLNRPRSSRSRISASGSRRKLSQRGLR